MSKQTKMTDAFNRWLAASEPALVDPIDEDGNVMAALAAKAFAAGAFAGSGATVNAEPVAWQFFEDSKWWNGDDQIKDHRKNTESAGIPTRDLYAHPPAVAVPDVVDNWAEPVLYYKHLSGNDCKPDGRCYDIAFCELEGYQPLYAKPQGVAVQYGCARRDALLEARHRINANPYNILTKHDAISVINGMLAATQKDGAA